MADDASMALDELPRQVQPSEDVDFLREGVRALAQALMELEVTQHLGAGRYERAPKRRGDVRPPFSFLRRSRASADLH